nr:hypothetical protein [Noviherbaspirillum saxi]
MTGWEFPARGCPTARQLSAEQKRIDKEARLTISAELGHGRAQIDYLYLSGAMMQTFDLEQAAAFLRMHPEEVRRRAKLGLCPARSRAKPGCLLRMILLPMCVRAMLVLGKRCR